MANFRIFKVLPATILAVFILQTGASEETLDFHWFRVVGIEEGKDLDLRKDPDPASEVVSGLPHNATCVYGEGKPVRKGGVKFIYVSFWDWKGWADMKYLKSMKRKDCEATGDEDEY